MTAQGLDTLSVPSAQHALAVLEALIQEHGVDTIVVGIPKNMDGTEGKQAARVRKWAARLEQRTGCRVVPWDERLTTVAAHQTMHALGARVSQATKHDVDRIAATILLSEYLDCAAHRGPQHAP